MWFLFFEWILIELGLGLVWGDKFLKMGFENGLGYVFGFEGSGEFFEVGKLVVSYRWYIMIL